MAEAEAELVLDARAGLGEGSLWDAKRQVLYWVNIEAGEVHVYDPAAESDRTVRVGEPVGTVVARAGGGLMLAVKSGFARLDLETERVEHVCDPPGHDPELRFNDGKCDPAGRFWAGTITGRDTPGRAALYCLRPDGTARRMLGGVTNSNGIAWSLDTTRMYYIDTATATVWTFDYDVETGEIDRRRPAVRVPEDRGHPDGMTLDAEGMLWIAHWGDGSVNRWDPETGEPLRRIPVPASQTSSCAFGGPELDELYVTTARGGLDEAALAAEPHAGGLFRVRPGVTGVQAFEFAG
jgi:sugar lactone lactonase YvrE